VPLLEQVLKRNPKTVKLFFKNFPLPMHKFSRKAALAALAAEKQGKFWEFHDKLFASFNTLNDQKINDIAKELGLNMEQFKRDESDPANERAVVRDLQEGQQVGVRGTPTIFIDGILLKNRSPQGFQEMIDSQLHQQKN